MFGCYWFGAKTTQKSWSVSSIVLHNHLCNPVRGRKSLVNIWGIFKNDWPLPVEKFGDDVIVYCEKKEEATTWVMCLVVKVTSLQQHSTDDDEKPRFLSSGHIYCMSSVSRVKTSASLFLNFFVFLCFCMLCNDFMWHLICWRLFTSFQVLEKVDVEQKMSIRFLHWSAASFPLNQTLTQGRSRHLWPAAGLNHFGLLGSDFSSYGRLSALSFTFASSVEILARNHTRVVVVWIKGNIHVPSVVDPGSTRL